MSPRARVLAACAAAVAAVSLTYANHFGNSFHFDDAHAIEQNPAIRRLSNLPRIFSDASAISSLPSNRSYRPLVTATLALDYALGQGLEPVAFHADSFLWFLLQCALLFLWFRRVLGSDWAALFGAALFGLHPAMAETVNYLIARSDLLSALGALACVLLWAQGGRARRFHLYLLPAALGVLAKEQGAMAAPLLFLWIGLIEQQQPLSSLLHPRNLVRAVRPALPAFAVCGGLVLLAMRMAPGWVPGGSSRWLYLATEPWVLLHYVAMFFLPVALTADTDLGLVSSIADWRVLAGTLFVAGLIALAAFTSRSARTRPVAFGLLWFLVALVPTSSVVPLAEVANDHRMYFPFVGLALAAACAGSLLAGALAQRPLGRAVPVAALLLLAAAAWGTWQRNQVWRTEESLWQDVTRKSPGNARGWMNYGLALMGRGEYAGAERAYQTALALAPGYGTLHVNLGVLKGKLGRPAEAEQHFQRGMQLQPEVPHFPFLYGRFLAETGRAAEAEQVLRVAIAAAPEQADPHTLLLSLLAKRQAWDELRAAAEAALRVPGAEAVARAHLQEAQRPAAASAPSSGPPVAAAGSDPRTDTLLGESLLLYQQGRYAASLAAADEAVRLTPGSAPAHNNRCAALNALHRFDEAAAACREALRLAPGFELARNNLRVAFEGGAR